MGVKRPYFRNCRQFVDGTYASSGQSRYILDPRYAKQPEQYIRAFMLIQKDTQHLFEYIDTSDINLKCYSFRVHEIFMRACIEVEANCKAILNQHGYKKDKMTMIDYKKLEKTHRLSSYQVKIPHWTGSQNIRTPFSSWSSEKKGTPEWYKAYNKAKHNRHEGFEAANFENLIDSVCGLLVIISSQFYTHDFSSGSHGLAIEGYGESDGMEAAIGNYFRIKFPDDWPDAERYEFTHAEWRQMLKDDTFFQIIDYSTISV